MNKLTKTLGLTALVLGMGIGCSNNNENSSTTKEKPEYETLIAKPIGVGESYAKNDGNIAIVVSLGTEQILCYTDNFNKSNPLKSSQGVALINAEINDSDNEPIKMLGNYEGNKFIISKLIVGKYAIEY